MSDLAGAFIVVSLIAFVVVGLLYALRRPITAGWRALRTVNLRRVVLVAALLTIAWLGAYPPWSYTFSAPQASQVVKAGPRAFILAPPPIERTRASNGITVDLSRLLIEWFVVGAVAAALAALLPRPRPRSRGPAPAETDDDGSEAAPCEVDEAETSTPPASRSESAAPIRDDPDDPVAWSNRTSETDPRPVREWVVRRIREMDVPEKTQDEADSTHPSPFPPKK